MSSMESHIYDIQIRVLIYKEDGEFAARALELDLIGYGKTEVEAVEELKGVLEAQISFAHQMQDKNLIEFPAEKALFSRWDEAQRLMLAGQIFGDKSIKLKAKAYFISFTREEIKALQARTFKRTDNLICA
ncbi:MAG TPA: hypothetical protein VGN23_11110 [Verrucomicrobiae bacterium]|jgi:hypothetical protein